MKNLIFILIPFTLYPQPFIEQELDSAFNYAKKGIYWALTNYNPEKNRNDNELIFNNKLYASVKLNRGIDGVKIESRGFFNSTEVNLKIYRSEEYLEKEGYLKKSKPVTEEKEKKKKKKS